MDNNGNLQISVTNFGPIESAEIDLRPLTVFVGPSNTGKSYLAILIYALHRFVNAGAFGRLPREMESRNLSEEDARALAAWIDSLNERMDKDSDDFNIRVPDSIRFMVQPAMENLGELVSYLNLEVARCFGVENAAALIRHGNGDEMDVRLRIPVSENPTGPIEYGLTVKPDKAKLALSIPDDAPLHISRANADIWRSDLMQVRSMLDANEPDQRKWSASALAEYVTQIIEDSIIGPLSRPAHYLPADRTGVMHAHRLAVGSLIARAPYAGLQRDEPLPLLSGVLADFLGELTQMGGPQNPMTQFRQGRRDQNNGARKLAKTLESEILGGAVNIRQSPTGYPSFYYQPDGWERELPLMNVSSMVSEIAPVALYLRHVVSEGDTLIIEEPESHLHPALQVEFVRQLAAVARSGVRVMITTHSEWVMDELINLVRLSELEPDERPPVGGANYAISHEQLGMWKFERGENGRGSAVKEIAFEEEIGNFRSGFSEVAEGTYNDYARISNRISYLANNKREETE